MTSDSILSGVVSDTEFIFLAKSEFHYTDVMHFHLILTLILLNPSTWDRITDHFADEVNKNAKLLHCRPMCCRLRQQLTSCRYTICVWVCCRLHIPVTVPAAAASLDQSQTSAALAWLTTETNELSLFAAVIIKLTSLQSTCDITYQDNDVVGCGSSGQIEQLVNAVSQLQKDVDER